MSNNTSVLDNTFDAIGLIGGFVFPICNIPQIIQIIKTKSSKDLSLASILIYIFGTVTILLYGIYFDLYAIYVPSIFEFVFEHILLILKCKYDDDLKKKLKCKKTIENIKDISKNSILKDQSNNTI